MKKVISLLISVSLILALIPVMPTMAASETVIFEEDFENGIDRWEFGSKVSDESNTY